MKKIYNHDDVEYSDLLNDLKNLPKINAPDNFEYNLSTKIQNKNFGNVKDEKIHFSWIKFLAPSGVVVAAILLFFMFLPSSQENDNRILQQPNMKNNQTMNDNSSAAGIENKNHSTPTTRQSLNSNTNSLKGPSNISSRSNQLSPISDPRSIRLDDFISGTNGNQKNSNRGNVVSNGENSTPYDGFIVSEKPDQKTLEKYRAVVDSIKKAQLKADSLKKALK